MSGTTAEGEGAFPKLVGKKGGKGELAGFLEELRGAAWGGRGSHALLVSFAQQAHSVHPKQEQVEFLAHGTQQSFLARRLAAHRHTGT